MWPRADATSVSPGMGPALHCSTYSNWSLTIYPFFSSSKPSSSSSSSSLSSSSSSSSQHYQITVQYIFLIIIFKKLIFDHVWTCHMWIIFTGHGKSQTCLMRSFTWPFWKFSPFGFFRKHSGTIFSNTLVYLCTPQVKISPLLTPVNSEGRYVFILDNYIRTCQP